MSPLSLTSIFHVLTVTMLHLHASTVSFEPQHIFRVTKFKLERSQSGGIIRSKYGDFNYFINYILLNFLLHFLNFFCYMFDRVEIHGVQFLHINYQCFLSANLISSPLHSFRMRITFSLPKEGQ